MIPFLNVGVKNSVGVVLMGHDRTQKWFLGSETVTDSGK